MNDPVFCSDEVILHLKLFPLQPPILHIWQLLHRTVLLRRIDRLLGQ
ncbi:hypothetical protein HanPSC8_Chr07g0305231 [Helianthus annuus]|nr:hypothetical protein HanPSC8_Chr07g0305231 [Helianthus annuus]